MAEIQDPAYLENGSHPSQGDRLVLSSLVATEGVVGTGDLAVTERGAGANMSVDVAAGAAFIAGTQLAHQGAYHVYNDAVVNLAVAAADATNPRIDLVVARVHDSFYAGATDDWALEVATGTAKATPSEPAVPDNSIVLARIDVAAGASSITDADITDRREQAVPRGGGLVGRIVYTASDTFDPAEFPWLRHVLSWAQGAGGGGGGAEGTGSGQAAVGAGGSGGDLAQAFVPVASLGGPVAVTVGGGGSGAVGNLPGSDGGDSSFGTHAIGGGGLGGGRRGAHSVFPHFVTGTASGPRPASTGELIAAGGPGGPAFSLAATRAVGGQGGDAPLGAGGPAVGSTGASNGVDGGAYGGGGSGAANAENVGQRTGGSGADGVVIVELYA